MENQNRCVFALNGLTGFFIAVALLLSILAGLTIWGLKAQQDVMQKPYTLEKAGEIKEFGSKKEDHITIKELK